MHRLVALDLPGGEPFVEAMRRLHDDGDAVFPIDQRLPDRARARLVSALRPAAVVDEGGEHALSDGLPIEEGDAFVVATSGTSGEPKGAVLTHQAVAASADAANARLGIDPDSDRWLCCLPVAHVGGLSVITRAVRAGVAVEVQPGFEAEAVCAAASERWATRVSLVPTAMFRLGDRASLFRTILLGGGAIPADRPANTVATYGLTETASGVVYDGYPLDGVELRVAPSGEIEVRGPMLLRCYRDGSDPKDSEGWLATGDAGQLDDNGELSVHGRIAEVIRSGGEAVHPTTVESLIRRHPLVGEVAVIGVPDGEWGERVVAFVEPKGDGAPTLDELRELVSGELGAMHAPRQLVVVGTLPRTAIGKVRRDELRAGASR